MFEIRPKFPCEKHKVMELSYEEWCIWIQEMKNKGKQQHQCPDCYRMFFEEEM